MRPIRCLVALACIAAGAAWGQALSPAEVRVAAAAKRVAADSKSWEAYNDLAFALCRAARDTGNLATYKQAEAALQTSVALSPGNYDAQKLSVTVLLGQHEFERARTLAVQLNHQVPDDISAWALLVDVYSALGEYSGAERSAQMILDLRRGSTLGFLKAAQLRDIFGDPEGAMEFFEEARKRSARNDADEQSWLLTQEAHEALLTGNPQHAEALLKQAKDLFSDSQCALAGLADVRFWLGQYGEAAGLLEEKYHKSKDPADLFRWAEALERSGEKDRAISVFGDFLEKAEAAKSAAYNWNTELIYLYCTRLKADKGLDLATREVRRGQNWMVLEAYAWALFCNGQVEQARSEMAKVSELGVRDPEHSCQRAQIERRDVANSCSGETVAGSAIQALR
jgi:tetratricopeptide (TPR) repeat protein